MCKHVELKGRHGFLSGLPKPAVVKQAKCLGYSKFFQLFHFSPSDIVYTSTPLYHVAAGGVGLMNVLDQGKYHSNFMTKWNGLIL